MRRELKRLEGLVSAAFADDERFVQLCSRVDDWRGLFARAFEHGVAGLLDHRIEAVDFSVPAPERERAQERFAIDRLWHRRVAADLHRILEVFEQHALRAVALKGLVLAERVYPRATLRPAGDLDLLVTAADLERAEHALAAVGFVPREWLPHETPPEHALMFEHAGGGSVDLHHLASDGFATTMTAGGLIERSIPYRTESGGETWILAPEDELLYLAVHAARHRFTRLGWLVDLGLLIARHPDLHWDVVATRARSYHVQRAAAVTGAVFEERLGTRLPAPIRAALAPDSRARMALELTRAATDRARYRSAETTLPAKAYRVLCDHTFHALLGEGIAASLAYWWRSVTRSAGRLV